VPDLDLHHWFDHEELEPCAFCGERTGIRLPSSGLFLCLGCGEVAGDAKPADAPAKEPDRPTR
jgi:hypothetical protein